MANHPNAPQETSQQKTIAPGVELLPKERVEYLAETYDLRPPQVIVVRNAICVGATDAELEFFLATCKRVGLDPFARQIWFIKRPQKTLDARGNEAWLDVGRPETSIDGYRTIAERTGEYEGQGAMLWCDAKGKWTDVWLDDAPPHAAKATIYRKGFREALTNVALYREFCPVYKNGKSPEMWRKMAANQIAKCAEAGGFRRAFPRDLSGLVTDTEMEHVDVASQGGGYSAPAIPTTEQKQLAEKKPSVQVPAQAEQPKPMTVGEAAKAIGKITEQPTELQKSLASSEDELDRELARLIGITTGAATRGDLGDKIGPLISQAKQRRKETKEDAHANMIVEVLEPIFQKKWRELQPAVTR